MTSPHLQHILDIPRNELGPKPNNYEQPWLAHYKTQAAIDKIAALYKEDVENLAYQVPTLITS